MASFIIKKNDLSPSIQTTLLDGNDEPVDITGNLGVRFHMKDADGLIVIDQAATVVDALGGVVKYDWVAADTDVAGAFEAEFEVTYADSKPETFPNSGYIAIQMDEDIA